MTTTPVFFFRSQVPQCWLLVAPTVPASYECCVVHLYTSLEPGMQSVLPLPLIFFYQTLHTLSVLSKVHSEYEVF